MIVSQVAVNQPKFLKISFLYPIIESAVLITLYTKAPHKPKKNKIDFAQKQLQLQISKLAGINEKLTAKPQNPNNSDFIL